MECVIVHVCCAHCSAYTVNFWQKQGYNVKPFWYNPNIHPNDEHRLRFEATKKLLEKYKIPLLVDREYDPNVYFDRIVNHKGKRCESCICLRLEETALQAQKQGVGAFTSSLLISPHMLHEQILLAGHIIAENRGLKFLYSDLRRRFSDSRVLTKHESLYRQEYCGCVYSKKERGL